MEHRETTSYLQGQRLLVLQRLRNTGRCGVAIGITLLGIFLSASTHAAVFTVNSPVDVSDASPGNGICETAPGNGACTLRAAIQESNALAGIDQINLPPNTYVLTLVSELAITDSLTITGGGASPTIIDGNKSVRPNSRVLVAGSGITVNISGVTIRNGGTGGQGGGIFNVGILTLTNSTVSGNNAAGGGGGILNDAGGTLTLTNSTVSGNNANVDGGGIFNDHASTMTLTNSTVSGNTTGDDGGGIINDHGSTATLTNSTVSGNDAGDDGGGIRNFGTTNLFSSTIANNRAGLNSSPTNFGGGGVHNFGGTLTLTNSTVSGNVARTHGGGIFNETGTVASFSSTIANNRADAESNGSGIGAGVYNWSELGATFNFQNTIIANNQVGSNPNNIRDCAGVLFSQGYNLIRITPAGECIVAPVTGDVFSSDPLLGPLQNNGGPTQTHALLAGSPAIDAGNPSGCRDNLGALLATDQRGFLRPADGDGNGTARCDIGAYEAKAVTGPEAFVFKQYEDFLDREPDSGEFAAWVNALDSGLPRASLIEAFMDSEEFRFEGKFIAQTYLGILTRDADVGGFEAWLGALLAGISREQIVQEFLVSGEFQSRFGSNLTNGQFVERMYNNILLRPSDPGGLNGWVQALNSGQMTRAQVALVFLDSGEFQSLIASQNRVDISLLYFDMLRRNPDAGGFSAWVGMLNAGVPLTSVIDGFLNSSEYQARF